MECVSELAGYTTVGRKYEIIDDYGDDYAIRDDTGGVHIFSKKPDMDGLSYATWFVIKSETEEATEVEKGITVLVDETIGGVEREYREVKRAAAKGERIKIVAAETTCGAYRNGDTFIVDRLWFGDCVESDAAAGDGNSDGMITGREYVVLEPTDIVRIDGESFRLADRAATKGERIFFVSSVYGITAGTVYKVIGSDDDGGEFKDDQGDYRWQYTGKPKSYVIEPVESVESVKPAQPAVSPDFQRQFDELSATVAALSDKVVKFETQLRVVREDVVVSADIAQLRRIAAVPKPNVTASKPSRDEIVSRAKEDVVKLSRENRNVPGKSVNFWPEVTGEKTVWIPMQKVEFVVNREKRTVVAIIRMLTNGAIYGRGIAKAAPGDVFNEYLGKAIALRRALKLPVPAEYTDAPQPEGVRVGDVVRGNYSGEKAFVERVEDGRAHGEYECGRELRSRNANVTVIDDTARYEDSVDTPSAFSVGDRVRVTGKGGGNRTRHHHDLSATGEIVNGPDKDNDYWVRVGSTGQFVNVADLEAA